MVKNEKEKKKNYERLLIVSESTFIHKEHRSIKLTRRMRCNTISYLMTQCPSMLSVSARLYPNPRTATSRADGRQAPTKRETTAAAKLLCVWVSWFGADE